MPRLARCPVCHSGCTNGLSRKRGMTRLRLRTASGVEAPSDRHPNGTSHGEQTGPRKRDLPRAQFTVYSLHGVTKRDTRDGVPFAS